MMELCCFESESVPAAHMGKGATRDWDPRGLPSVHMCTRSCDRTFDPLMGLCMQRLGHKNAISSTYTKVWSLRVPNVVEHVFCRYCTLRGSEAARRQGTGGVLFRGEAVLG